MSETIPIGAVIARLLAIAHESGRADLVHVAAGEWRARRIAEVLDTITSHEVLLFPHWDCLPYDRVSPSREVMGERMAVLRSLDRQGKAARLVVTTPDALLQRVPPRAALRTLEVRARERLTVDALRSFCEAAGYILDERVDEVGEAAFRGEVVDIFPAGSAFPVRMEVREGHIAAIRAYDSLTQRTRGEIPSLLLGPVSELPGPGGSEDPRPHPPGALPNLGTLFDYVPEARLVIEPDAALRCHTVLATISEAFKDRLGERNVEPGSTRRIPEPGRLYLGEGEWRRLLEARGLELGPIDHIKPIPSFAAEPRPGRALADFLKDQWAARRRIVLAGSADASGRITRRAERILERTPAVINDWQAVLAAPRPSLLSLPADLEEGFLDANAGIVVIAAPDVLGSRARNGHNAARRAESSLQAEAAEFHIGDLVVHADHGVGILRGLERVDMPEGPREAVRLSYADEATLLVPIAEVDKLWRYGSEEGSVSPDRLEGDGWSRRRAQIIAEARRTARAMHAEALRREVLSH